MSKHHHHYERESYPDRNGKKENWQDWFSGENNDSWLIFLLLVLLVVSLLGSPGL